ncbi:hypothetical protein VAPA_2c00900 [Variovorax paradoxus B4]|uniref:Uncharacterized protein n=1 Tax=Variovorax paradoxus B4 TaxID=1246301 RepID=T1XJB2_VARPD|nr:hypothetical protein VAPA_2c00900 [Variovorax paradoxus B4]
MKFVCPCGAVVRDNTDYQEHKAYFIPDQLYEGAAERIEAGGEVWAEMRRVTRPMYQCSDCCRLFLSDDAGNLVSFKPDDSTRFGILKGKL